MSEADKEQQDINDEDFHRGHWILQVPDAQDEWCRDKLLPSLEHAGLRYTTFRGSKTNDIIILVFATLERLQKEAATPRNQLAFALDRDRLREADIDMNAELQKEGMQFNPKDEETELQGDDLAIPKMKSILPGQESFDPYMYIFAPYFEEKHNLYYHHRHGSANSPFDNLRTLILIRQILRTEESKGGAGMDAERLIAREKLVKLMPGKDKPRHQYLKVQWLNFCQIPWDIPLEAIQNYFGARIAMYYAFFKSYTMWLGVLSIIGLIIFPLDWEYAGTRTQSEILLFFSLVVSLWAVAFSEKWKRNENVFSKKWGTSHQSQDVTIRPSYIRSKEVKMERSYTTGIPQYWRSPLLRVGKSLLSNSIMSTAVGILIVVVLSIFYLRIVLRRVEGLSSTWASHISSIVTGAQIQITSFLYHLLAHWLVEWENHPTDTGFENSLSMKLASFQFINSYFSLFYIAFVKGNTEFFGADQPCLRNSEGKTDCLYELRFQLVIIFLMRMAMTIVAQLILPALTPMIAKIWDQLKSALQCCCRADSSKQIFPEEKDDDDYNRDSLERELEKPIYDPFKEYLDLLLQYGYVTLFVSAFPLVPALATAVNVVEIRLDSYRLLRLSSRPTPRMASGIGDWKKLLLFLTIASVVTNLAILAFTVEQPWFGANSQLSRFGVAVLAEHCILGLRYAVEEGIPDIPYNVQIQLQRQTYLVRKHIYDEPVTPKTLMV